MGNSFAKNYDCPKEHTATAGRDDLLWRIWPGKHKETKAEASIWVFDKADIGKKKTYPQDRVKEPPTPVIEKAILEQVLHIMKKDMLALQELKATGKVVQFIELIEESKGGVIFCTEKVICSLADIMDGFEHIPQGKGPHREFFGEECILSELEIARGISNIAESLQVVHNVHRKLHMNITPSSIMLTAAGEWKLCGLGFNLGMKPGESSIASPYFLAANPKTSIRLEPDLCYCAPEVTGGGYNNISNSIRSVSTSSDMFSLGVVAYELFYLLKTNAFALDVIRDPAQTHYKLIPVTNNNTINHPMALENIANTDLSVLPGGFTPIFRLLISSNNALRMTSVDIVNSAYFTTGPLATLRNLDALMNKDIGAQSSLLALLPSQLSSFSSRLLENSVLIPVCKACLVNPNLWTFAIPVHDYIVQYLTRFRYRSITGPFVRRALEDAKSVEVMHVLLKNIRFFLECFSDSSNDSGASIGSSKPLYIADAVVAVFSNSLDKARHPIQILALQLLCDSTVRHSISVQSMVTVLIPKICKEACKNPDPNVKLHALYLLSLITNCLDKQFIIDNILPSLRYIIDHDKNTTVAMAVVGNYEAIADVLGTDYVALAILPAIIPLMADRTLDFKQTDTLIATITLLMKRVVDMRAAEMGSNKPTWNISISRDSQDVSGVLDPFAVVKKLIETANKEATDIYKSKTASIASSTNVGSLTAAAAASSSPTTFTSSVADSDFLANIGGKSSSQSNSASNGQTIKVNPEDVAVVRVKKAVPVVSPPPPIPIVPSTQVSNNIMGSTASGSSGGFMSNVKTPVPVTDYKPSNQAAANDIDMSDFLQSFGSKLPVNTTSVNNNSKSGSVNADSMYDFISNPNPNPSAFGSRAPIASSNSNSNNNSNSYNGGLDLFGGMQINGAGSSMNSINTGFGVGSGQPNGYINNNSMNMGMNMGGMSMGMQQMSDPFGGNGNNTQMSGNPNLQYGAAGVGGGYNNMNNNNMNNSHMYNNGGASSNNIGNLSTKGYMPPKY